MTDTANLSGEESKDSTNQSFESHHLILNHI